MGNLCKTLLLCGATVAVTATAATAQVKGNTVPYTCGFTTGGKTTAWQKITAVKQLKLQPVSGTAKIPAAYTVYTIPEKQLKQFLMAVKAAPEYSMQFSLPLPENEDCQQFLLADAHTMAPALAAKYPQLVSLKGHAPGNRNATLRLDYDGANLRAELSREGTIYLLSPWKSGKKKYYLIYKKEDAGIEKRKAFRG